MKERRHDTLDRREFVCAVASAGALAVLTAPAGHATEPTPAVRRLDDWTIDDMWGVYPRPSEAIGYGRPPAAAPRRAAPADAPFVP